MSWAQASALAWSPRNLGSSSALPKTCCVTLQSHAPVLGATVRQREDGLKNIAVKESSSAVHSDGLAPGLPIALQLGITIPLYR